MVATLDQLSDTSRVWVYQSNRALTEQEQSEISKKLEAFVADWRRHGDLLTASFEIKYDHFIILAVDESSVPVSGCSIDSSTHFIKQLERDYNLDLLNKMNTAFRFGENINIVSLSEFKKFIELNKIDQNTIVFNNMVSSLKELKHQWEIEASKSWHSRFLN